MMNPQASRESRRSALISRRAVVRGAALGAAAISIVPRHVLGGPGQTPPSEKITLAAIGVGGVGFGQVKSCDQAGFQVNVLCDIDDVYAKKAYTQWPQAKRYRDYREMLQAEGDKVDAVYCGTPDHTHAVIVVAALKRKKHVCCVKPLTRTLHECRAVVQAAREARTATQVTAAPNTSETACRTVELIQAGAIGQVREVHIWSNRPLWPQGMDRPAGQDPVPSTFDWDLWLGPAPMRPFKDRWPEGSLELKQITGGASKGVYHPWNFRGWWDFGTGALGDMGCHYLNTPYRALKLRSPRFVSASCTKMLSESFPLGAIVTYDFPAREGMGPVRVVWYDGGLKPAYPVELGGKPLEGQGALYIGDEGKMLGPVILDAEKAKKFEATPRTLVRRSGTWGEWHEACRGGEAAGCNFEWAGPLTEFVLLGNIAMKTNKRIEWDPQAMRITNEEAANKYVQEPYRAGWSL